jgi:hypothetical protein
VREITDAVARHGSEISFSYGATFTNPWQEQLAEALVAMNPGRISSVLAAQRREPVLGAGICATRDLLLAASSPVVNTRC